MNHTLQIDSGMTFTETIEIKDDAGVAENLTGSTFLMQIRDYAFSIDTKIHATSDNGLIQVTPLSGVVTLSFPPSETIKLTSKQGVYDLIQTKPTGDKIKILEGTVEVTPTVSRV